MIPMNGKSLILLGLIVFLLLGGLLYWISHPGAASGSGETLTLYCAAGIKKPVRELVDRFEAETGVHVELQYGGSGTLLSNIEVARQGDLYIAADQSYVDIAEKKGLIDEVLSLGYLRPVIAVPKGNPKEIKDLDDLLRSEVRVALGNPESASVGKLTKKLLEQAGMWEKIKARVEKRGVFKPTVPEIANDVKIGAVDAAIVWDATVAQHPELEAVHVPLLDGARQEISVTVLDATKQPTGALRLARFLNSKEGNAVFKKHGFAPVEGDAWAVHPEITFFCGSVNRRAIEDVIKAFEKREGVTVNTVYNGCGILTGQMRTINQEKSGAGFPDAYMACDRYYLENVKDWFQEDVDVSDADIVIVVPQGNPKKIQGIADLTKAGMRVSVGQPKQCTIGALTRTMLQKMNVYDDVMENVVMQTASSAMLVPTVTTGSVDATIAYITDTLAESDKVDYVRIDSDFAKAVQPFSIARSSEHKYLGRRLFQAIAEAGERFTDAGFHFRLVEESDEDKGSGASSR